MSHFSLKGKTAVMSIATNMKKHAWIGPTLITAILLAVSIFVFTYVSAKFFSNIQDAIVYKYLFANFHLNDIVLPGNHTNLLKFPIFITESFLPEGFHWFFLVNFSMVALCTVGWGWLTYKITGEKTAPVIMVLLSAILLAPSSLVLNLSETTIRNIEYPIGLLFALSIWLVINKTGTFTKQRTLLIVSSCLLFVLAMAGDTFMAVSFGSGILIALLTVFVRERKLTKGIALAGSITLGSIILSQLIQKLIPLSGIAQLYFAPQFKPRIVDLEELWHNFSHAMHQLLDLFGANIFQANSLQAKLLSSVMLCLLLFGMTFSIIRIVKMFYHNQRTDKLTRSDYAVLMLTATFLASVGAYIIMGYAVQRTADGSFVDSSQIRYLTLTPFILITLIVIALKDYRHAILNHVVIVLFVCLVIASGVIANRFNNVLAYANYVHKSVSVIIDTANQKKIKRIVSGDTYGAVVQYWSGDKLQYASVLDCNHQMTHNKRLSWYAPSGQPTGLIVDRMGVDAQYWESCSNDMIHQIYGEPTEIITLDGDPQGKSLQFWVYPYDIRERIIR